MWGQQSARHVCPVPPTAFRNGICWLSRLPQECSLDHVCPRGQQDPLGHVSQGIEGWREGRTRLTCFLMAGAAQEAEGEKKGPIGGRTRFLSGWVREKGWEQGEPQPWLARGVKRDP